MRSRVAHTSRTLAALLTLVLVGVQGLAVIDGGQHEHHYCPEHNAIEHGHDADGASHDERVVEAAHAAKDGTIISGTGDQPREQHSACESADWLFDSSAQDVQQTRLVVTAASAGGCVDSTVVHGPAHSSVLAYAPKCSPPLSVV